MVLFKDSTALSAIEHHANYIIRKGSKDLGSRTLEGSRPGMAMLVHAGFYVIGRKGYEILIDGNIEKAKQFATLIDQSEDFELIAKPELNILAYRYVPTKIQKLLARADRDKRRLINAIVDQITRLIQKSQRAAGKSFVSRTNLNPQRYGGDMIVVFRVVLANPLTTMDNLQAVLDEQREMAGSEILADLMSSLEIHI